MDTPFDARRIAPETVPDPVRRARALIPLLDAAGPRIDAARELPPDIDAAMHANGMFRLLLPRFLGGEELEPATYIQAVEAIAMGDGSAAWCMNQGSGCSMTAAYLEPDVAREIFAGPTDVLAWGQGKTRAVKAPGGWRVTGRSHFASGIRHADGAAFERSMLFRKGQAVVTDNWQVMGLRG